MNIKDLVSYLAKQEGKKSQVAVGDIREVVAALSDLLHEISLEDDGLNQLEEFSLMLARNGKRRAKSKKKK